MNKMAAPIKVAVTGAAGQIGYCLIYQIASGAVFGPEQPVYLHLLDIAPMMSYLEGVAMELIDCILPLLAGVSTTVDPEEAFKDVAAAFLVGAKPRGPGMQRKDLLSANVFIFKEQGKALDKVARKDVKVLIVGNPANTNALICSKYAPSIPKENFTAMMRLDQNRADVQLAEKLGVPVQNLKNVVVWGNHSSTLFPDASNAIVKVGGVDKPVSAIINDDKYLTSTFLSDVRDRSAAVLAAKKISSVICAAKAASDTMKDWFFGTGDRWISMGVVSDGEYDTPKDIVYSFPVTVSNGQWKIVQGITISDFARTKLDATVKELVEEKQEALEVCKD